MIRQTFECVQQPKAFIQSLEIDIMDYSARQATAINTALDKIPVFVADTPRSPAADICAPLNIRSTLGSGRLAALICFTEFRIMAEIGVVDGQEAILQIRTAEPVGHVGQGG
jgi:hypothetical protein